MTVCLLVTRENQPSVPMIPTLLISLSTTALALVSISYPFLFRSVALIAPNFSKWLFFCAYVERDRNIMIDNKNILTGFSLFIVQNLSGIKDKSVRQCKTNFSTFWLIFTIGSDKVFNNRIGYSIHGNQDIFYTLLEIFQQLLK